MIPRIIVKRDSESSIGRGCVLRADHFRPEIANIVYAAAKAAEQWKDSIEEMHLTEGWRPRRVAGRRDLHTTLCALDITFREAGDHLIQVELEAIAAGMVDFLRHPEDYDLVVHGEGRGVHIHAELDPK